MSNTINLIHISRLGEGQRVEFKERISPNLAREMVAFANSEGGTIYCGIADNGRLVGIQLENRTLSEVYDIARNCEPSIPIQTEVLSNNVVAVHVPSGAEKPYQCSEGFFIRNGPNSQKMRSSEIRRLLTSSRPPFDGEIAANAPVERSLDRAVFNHYAALASIDMRELAAPDMLINIGAAIKSSAKAAPLLTNAGVLLFSRQPNRIIPEAHIAAVRYEGTDKFSIIDRKEFTGDVIAQIDASLEFLQRHTSVSYVIDERGGRSELREYPGVALREAVINAVTHRDYSFHNSCIYIHLFADRLEIENPGGVVAGLALEELAGRSVRRNPLLADLLYRAGYGEKVGSGLLRMKTALHENGNPPYVISSTNFFSIRLLPRIATPTTLDLSDHQLNILRVLRSSGRGLSSQQLASELAISSTTVTRELRQLLEERLVQKLGQGRATVYVARARV